MRREGNSVMKRKAMDLFRKTLAYLFSSFGILILIAVIFFVIDNGKDVISWDFITSDYNTTTSTLKSDEEKDSDLFFSYQAAEDEYFSSSWGIAFIDSRDNSNSAVVKVSYLDASSPLTYLVDKSDSSYISLREGEIISGVILKDNEGLTLVKTGSDGAEQICQAFNQGVIIKTLTVTSEGGGIRGSLISTLYLIGLTLIFCLPLGVITAIYLEEYAKKGKLRNLLRKMIDLAGGIPSIIYGLIGAIIFIPLVNLFTSSSGGSLISGALTLSLMLLPTIVSSSCEALREIPSGYESSSLALGASKTQTVFKVVLPNASIGLLTGALLAVGRIIGESAALIYSCSTAIKDSILVNAGSATLAVHIWSLLGQETPDYGACSAIAIIILGVDLVLNFLLKAVAWRFNKKISGKKKG